MIPIETLADLATLGLSRDQAEAVSRMLRSVEDATRAEASSVTEARRAKDRDRKALSRRMSAECQEKRGMSAEVRGHPRTSAECQEKRGMSADIDPSRAEYNTTRAQTVIPVGLSNDNPPIELFTPKPIGLDPQEQTALRKPKRAKNRTRIADDAQPSGIARDFAAEIGMQASDFRTEWAQFRDYHLREGSLMADWDAAWRTWGRNWLKRLNHRPRAGPQQPNIDRWGPAAMWLEMMRDENDRAIEKTIDYEDVLGFPVGPDHGP